MGLDVFIFEQESTITSIIFRPATADLEALLSVIGIGIFVGSILGVMIDGIGHWIFEDKIFESIVKNLPMSDKDVHKPDKDRLTIGKAEQEIFGYWKKYFRIADKYPKDSTYVPIPDIPESADYLFPFTYKSTDGDDKVKLKDELVKDYYSYFEFYLNSSISLAVVSVILGFYALTILNITPLQAFVTFAIVLAGSSGLFFASMHTLADYKRARVLFIEGYLRKVQQDE